MAGFGDARELLVLDSVFNNTAMTGSATLFLKLHIGDPGEDGTGNAAGETTRKGISFAAAGSGAVATSADLDWTSVSTSETYSHFSIWDNVTAGALYATGTLTPTSAITAGENFQIASGDLTFTLD